jgi:hypothetical protein
MYYLTAIAMENMAVEEMEVFFKNHSPLPKEVILGPGITISDLSKFIDSHLSILKGSVPTVSSPCKDRLLKLIEILKTAS